MSLWQIFVSVFSISFAVFILWMLVDCIRNEEDKNERVISAMLILFCGFIYAPVYFVQRHLPRREEMKKRLHP